MSLDSIEQNSKCIYVIVYMYVQYNRMHAMYNNGKGPNISQEYLSQLGK
jgi:hypothetical protein